MNIIKFKVNGKFKNNTLQLNRKRIVFYTYMFYIIYYKLHSYLEEKTNTLIEIWVKNISSLFIKEEINTMV